MDAEININSFLGANIFVINMNLHSLAFEMTSAHVVATALTLLPLNLLPAKLDIFVLAAVNASLFAFKVAALPVNPEEVCEQDAKASLASSSNFLHIPKASLHLFN